MTEQAKSAVRSQTESRTDAWAETSAEAIGIRAPSRLHFGLLSWGRAGRQFGGVGVMVERPGVEIVARPHDRFMATGQHAERVERFARLWAASRGNSEPPAVWLHVEQSPPEHVGLGVGTQLGLSVAQLLTRWTNLPTITIEALAASVGRGLRSAIGAHGFRHGGLIYEQGKQSHESLSPLWECVPLPAEWRFVLVRPAATTGLHGAQENSTFAKLPAVEADVSATLIEIAERRLLPAARAGDFVEFSRAVYEFGWRAGMCFAAAQGGPFNGPVVTRLVEQLRQWDVTGVGQSSWGPTVFALTRDPPSAERLAARLREDGEASWSVDITPVDNHGAREFQP